MVELDVKEEIGKRAKLVDEELARLLEAKGSETLVKAMKHYPAAGGKRLRPVLSMLVGDAISGKGREAMRFGIVLEMIHNFTLIHDDIMDRDELRRGVKTVHTVYGEPTAINAGDALFARAFAVLAGTEAGDHVVRQLLEETASMVYEIADGQQMDMDFEKGGDITPDSYMTMIEKKTAEMFRMAARGGALVAGGTREQVDKMTDYGRLIGVGFQVWDDLLDIKADEKALGKPVGSDIRNGKRTLIVLHGLENMDAGYKARFMQVLGNGQASQDEVDEAIGLLEKAGSIKYAEDLALQTARQARESLSCIRECEEKAILNEFIDYMVKRSY